MDFKDERDFLRFALKVRIGGLSKIPEETQGYTKTVL